MGGAASGHGWKEAGGWTGVSAPGRNLEDGAGCWTQGRTNEGKGTRRRGLRGHGGQRAHGQLFGLAFTQERGEATESYLHLTRAHPTPNSPSPSRMLKAQVEAEPGSSPSTTATASTTWTEQPRPHMGAWEQASCRPFSTLC